jgi:hypothetical protein
VLPATLGLAMSSVTDISVRPDVDMTSPSGDALASGT